MPPLQCFLKRSQNSPTNTNLSGKLSETDMRIVNSIHLFSALLRLRISTHP